MQSFFVESIQEPNQEPRVGITRTTPMYVTGQPTKHFYKCLYAAHITTEKLNHMDDETFPSLRPYKLGLTNLAHRPTAKSEQLTRAELERGVPELLKKIQKYRPRIVCFVGKQIGDTFLKVVHKRCWINDVQSIPLPRHVAGFWHSKPDLIPKADLGYGVLPICMQHEDTSSTLFFVTPSTSARVTHHLLPDKTRLFAHIPELLRPPEQDWPSVQVPCMKTTQQTHIHESGVSRSESQPRTPC